MNNFKRSSIALLTAIYLMVDVFGSLLFMSPVKAGSPVIDATLIAKNTATESYKEGKLSFTKILTMSAMGILVNAVSYFSRKLSHDAAIFLASGGKGQGALIFKEGVGEYMKNTALDTVGEAVGTLGEPFGLNLCQIPNPKLDINLRIGYRNMFPTGQEPRPKCSWKELEGSWGNIGSVMEKRYGPGGSRFVSETFNANLSVSQSDFGIALDAMGQLDNIHAEARAVAEIERTFTQGIKAVTSPISGKTMTPAISIQREIEGLSAAEQSAKTEGQIAGMYSAQLENLPAMAASVFLNTLISSLLTNIMSGLFSDTPDSASGGKGGTGLSAGVTSYFASALQSTRKAAQRIFNFLTLPTITQINDYKSVDQLFLMKAIDTGLQQAVNRGNNTDTAMTIGEALELNYLHRDWPLIPPSHTWNNNVAKDCYLKAYCYSNLQKIRKARILPLGFELAAFNSNPDEPWTLGKVVDGFDKCNQFGEADSTHPFCHLIDPNWVLKAPDARCRIEGVGPDLIQDGVNKRQTECMDLETCISKSDDGTCNYWGYCTKEENVWRLNGESCPDYYSTCTTYKNTETKQTASYLSRTVDFGKCDVKSVGCQAYSSEQSKDANGEWQWDTALTVNGTYKVYGRNQMNYFNRNVETCPANAEGCTAFYGAQRDPNSGIFNSPSSGTFIRDSANLIHLKKAPDYLSCYDTNAANGLVIDWPKSKTEVLTKLANNDARCNDFAQICAPEEVGCGRFTPVAGGSSVTAIVDTNSTCPKECVGYQSFKQEESNFESGKFPMYFIPDAGKVCSVRSVGCSEFTNLSSTVGGESLVYYSYARLCEKPDSVDESAFFSWEGSASEGYVLRNHLLKTISATELTYITGFGLTYTAVPSAVAEDVSIVFPEGSPSYGDNTRVNMQDNYNKCNVESYKLLITDPFATGAADADCRQLYDSSGNIFYRILRDTVIIDASCQKLRKSELNLFTDANILNSTQCSSQGGYWDTAGSGSCKRCYGGGQYSGNTCIYEALPSESAGCQAVDNGCRAYTGNAGNNVRPNIIFDTFEGVPATALQNKWVTGSPAVVAESLQTGQHSLKVSGAIAERIIPVGTISSNSSLNQNGWYELSFWARGGSRSLNISFAQGATSYGLFTHDSTNITVPNPITISNNWQEYRLGPVQFTGVGSSDVIIRIENSGASSGDYFLDNLSLSQVESSVYLVKDSWKETVEFNGQQILADAPLSCYMGVTPGGSVPGAALGCREYKDEGNNAYYITNFSSLCREAAVGCQPMFESNNTVGEVLATAYNLVCTGSVGQCTLNIFGTSGSCYIDSGETSCHVPKMVLPINSMGTSSTADDEYILLSDLTGTPPGPSSDLIYVPGFSTDISTIYIPPESSRPVYLTNVEQYQCGADQRGCTLLGLQDQTIPTTDTASYKYSNIYILNNPEYYDSILCRQDLIGCNEYTGGANAYYFKDPMKNGNYLCSYREGVDNFSGWFKDNVGECSDDASVLCKEDSDCSINSTCTKIGSVPCYPSYLQEGNYYNIWSNKSTNYEGFVGTCEQSYGGCTELLDPQDTSSLNPEGAPYYKVFDDRLTANLADCQGQVSLKEGCVLFNKTDQPNKLYSTQETYAASDNADPRYSLVNPVSSSAAGTPNNANLILKVNRDRACSEWLSCKSSAVQTNNKGEQEVVCSNYQACDKLKGGQQNKKEGCTHFIDPVYGETFLDTEKYIDRDVSWYGFDYSGYSILQKHQIGSYEYINFAGYGDKQFLGASALLPGYVVNTCVASGTDMTGQLCGVSGEGRCYGDKCIYPVADTLFEALTPDEINPPTTATDEVLEELRASRVAKMVKALIPATCKVYPEDTAPFPQSIAAEPVATATFIEGENSEIKKNTNSGIDVGAKIVSDRTRVEFVVPNDKFSGVNVCQDDEPDCSCNYKKYTYGTGAVTDYYSVASSTSVQFAPKGVCVGGDNAGQPCLLDSHCQLKDTVTGDIISAGSCSKLKQIDSKLGLLGFCLEPDLSRPINGLAKPPKVQEYACQTWLPIQTSASSVDIYNLNPLAGYNPDEDAAAGTAGGVMYCANSLQGGIVDTRQSITQADVNAGNYSSTVISNLFDGQYFSSDCQMTQDLKYDVNTGTFYCPKCQHDNFFPPEINSFLNESASVGVRIGQANTNGVLSVARVGYNPSVDAALFSHLVCNQYKNLEDRVVALSNQSVYNDYLTNLQSNVYKTLQSWAWGKIGPSAVVIRAEYGIDDTLGFAPINRESVAQFPAAGVTDAATGKNGRFVFANADQFINENNVKNIYFVPLNFKETMRGLAPMQINTLSSVDPLTDTVNYLKLPIANIKNFNILGKNATNADIPLGSIQAFNSTYIRHFPTDDGITPYYEHNYGVGSSAFLSYPMQDALWPDSIINWGGNYNGSDFLTDNPTVLGWRWAIVRNPTTVTLRNDDPATTDVDESTIGTNPFLVWRYKQTSGNITKYVLSWFANDTFPEKYSELGYDTAEPAFMTPFLMDHDQDTDATRPIVTPATPGFRDPFMYGDRYGDANHCDEGYVNRGTGTPPNSHSTEAERHNAWWAVSANFNTADGKFLGFTSKWCDGLGMRNSDLPDTNSHWSSRNAGINYAVIVELENQCTEFVTVHDAAATTGTRNKAWTNRVWGQSKKTDGTNNPLPHPFSDYWRGLTRVSLLQNFGSINEAGAADSAMMTKYYLEDPLVDGIPYACSQTLYNDNSGNVNLDIPCGFPKTSLYRTDGVFKGKDYTTLATEPGYTTPVLKNKNNSTASSAISSLFALFISDKLLNTISSPGKFTTVADAPGAVSDGGQVDFADYWNGLVTPASSSGKKEYLLPPRIFSLNPVTCPVNVTSGCTAGDADNITVNQINGVLKDYGNNGLDTTDRLQIEDQISRGAFDADVKFFAYADDNRMPIRKVSVNWGDGQITNSDKEGYYKNSKPFCSVRGGKDGEVIPLCQMTMPNITGTLPSGLPCTVTATENGDKDCPIELLGSSQNCLSVQDLAGDSINDYKNPRFGNTKRACSTVPFEFIHAYDGTCSPTNKARKLVSTLSNTTQQRLADMGVASSDYVCVFKPRVQVIDNWGYCNGRCTEGVTQPGGDFCYSKQDTVFADNAPNDTIDNGECEWPDLVNNNPNPNNAPYTEFKGNIIIIPE